MSALPFIFCFQEGPLSISVFRAEVGKALPGDEAKDIFVIGEADFKEFKYKENQPEDNSVDRLVFIKH